MIKKYLNFELNKKTLYVLVSALAVLCVLLGVLMFALGRIERNAVTIEAKPAVEFSVNRRGKVLKVTPLNEDGKTVIGDLKLKGDKIDTAVNFVVASMAENKFLDYNSNSILISVKGKSEKKSENLRSLLNDGVSKFIGKNLNTSILSQGFKEDEKISDLAKKHGISEGKALYINKIIKTYTNHTFEELSELSIHELNLICSSNKAQTKVINSVGKASDTSYIGTSKALSTVLNYLNITENDILNLYTGMDFEDGVMVYEIEFIYNAKENEFDVNALTGAILETENSTDINNFQNGTSTEPSNISKDEALQIAYKKAGVAPSQVYDLEVEFDQDDGVASWEIEFKVKDKKSHHSYDIRATDGKILKNEQKTKNGNTQITASTNSTLISKQEAQEIAFKHAGVSASKVRDLDIDFDDEKGSSTWEIEFKVEKNEYSYDINATDGTIINSYVEPED